MAIIGYVLVHCIVCKSMRSRWIDVCAKNLMGPKGNDASFLHTPLAILEYSSK